jgi:hypothetical protein
MKQVEHLGKQQASFTIVKLSVRRQIESVQPQSVSQETQQPQFENLKATMSKRKRMEGDAEDLAIPSQAEIEQERRDIGMPRVSISTTSLSQSRASFGKTK